MRLRAVVLDEDPLVRQLLYAVLDTRGYEVFTFPHPGVCPIHMADRCLCPIGTQCADVIVSGLHMPNVNGLDFIQALMEKGCWKPQFALTCEQWTETEIERASQLVCKVFMRPLRISSIIQWLEEIEASIAPARQLTNWYEHKWFAKGAGSDGEK